MAYQLPADCLNEVFEYLEKESIYACLLVNRLWCEVAVKILWRNALGVRDDRYQLVNTLVACLSDESKDFLYTNRIFISTLPSGPPLFDYISLIKVLPIDEIHQTIENFLKNKQANDSHLVLQELLKTFMNRISSLKTLKLSKEFQNISFLNLPEAKDCLAGLSSFSCHSDICPTFFNQLSQICHHIQTLTIVFENGISNELKELVTLQRI